VVFLDEPMLGIDLVVKKNIREFLKTICTQRNITILLTSHEIADIETLCERVIIINHGKKTWDGSLGVLRTVHGTKRRLEIEFGHEYPDFMVTGAELTESRGVTKVFSFGMDISPSYLINQISAKNEIVNLHIKEPQIEDIIADIYRSKEERK
jgi:ABC-2 type transport system ATP-binding protein